MPLSRRSATTPITSRQSSGMEEIGRMFADSGARVAPMLARHVLGNQRYRRLVVYLVPSQVTPGDQSAAHRRKVSRRNGFEAPYRWKLPFGGRLVRGVHGVGRPSFQGKYA